MGGELYPEPTPEEVITDAFTDVLQEQQAWQNAGNETLCPQFYQHVAELAAYFKKEQ